MKKIILINLILLSTGFLYAHEKDMMNKVPRDSKVNLEKNDSSSPVVVEGVKNRGELDSWIENYVETNYPGYNIGDREVDLSSKKSIIETVYLKNEQGNVIEVCFDITDYRKKFNELHKKEIIKIYSAKLFTHYLHQLFHIKIISDSISQSIITTLF